MSNASSKQKTVDTARSQIVRPWGITVAIVVAITGFILSQLVAQIIISVAPTLMGQGAAEADHWLKTPIANFIYVLLAEALTISILVWFVRLRKTNFWETIGLRKLGRWDVPIALLGFLCYVVVYAVILMLVSGILPINTGQEQAVGFAHNVRGAGLIMAFFSLVILPPLVEETVFRGFLYGTLRRRNVSFLWSAVIVSLLFGTMHLFGGGSGSIIIWIAFLDTFVLSLVLCYLREKTGSLWTCIGVHALKNAFVFVNLFIISAT
jgi:membrane protease YdiL (CAAX protease family)